MFEKLKDILIEKQTEVLPVKRKMAKIVEEDPLDVFSEFENDYPSEQPPVDTTDEA